MVQEIESTMRWWADLHLWPIPSGVFILDVVSKQQDCGLDVWKLHLKQVGPWQHISPSICRWREDKFLSSLNRSCKPNRMVASQKCHSGSELSLVLIRHDIFDAGMHFGNDVGPEYGRPFIAVLPMDSTLTEEMGRFKGIHWKALPAKFR